MWSCVDFINSFRLYVIWEQQQLLGTTTTTTRYYYNVKRTNILNIFPLTLRLMSHFKAFEEFIMYVVYNKRRKVVSNVGIGKMHGVRSKYSICRTKKFKMKRGECASEPKRKVFFSSTSPFRFISTEKTKIVLQFWIHWNVYNIYKKQKQQQFFQVKYYFLPSLCWTKAN
jgi:hypothetical protein